MSYERAAWKKLLFFVCTIAPLLADTPANATLSSRDTTSSLGTLQLNVGNPSLAWTVRFNKIKEKFNRDAEEFLQATLHEFLVSKFENQEKYREAQKISILLFDIFDKITFAYQQSATLAYANAGKARSLSNIDLQVYKNFLYNFIILQINSRAKTVSDFMAKLLHSAQSKDIEKLVRALGKLRASLARNIYASSDSMDTEFQKMLALNTLLKLSELASKAKPIEETIGQLEENRLLIDQIAKRW